MVSNTRSRGKARGTRADVPPAGGDAALTRAELTTLLAQQEVTFQNAQRQALEAERRGKRCNDSSWTPSGEFNPDIRHFSLPFHRTNNLAHRLELVTIKVDGTIAVGVSTSQVSTNWKLIYRYVTS